MPLSGLLAIDKPVGPTSHDVVARVRHALGERQIGHTGTLDPMASGVLPLVIGRATRLARFLNTDDKRYEATLCLGVSTDTYDAQGQPTGDRREDVNASWEAIDRALDAFRGTFLQQPPAFSAKKIDGRRSYQLARSGARAARATAPALPALSGIEGPALPAPASVTTHAIDLVSVEREIVTLRIVCSSGFYVRSLAQDLGVALGVGAHLTTLRRTHASGVALAETIPLAEIEDGPRGEELARAALIPLSGMLTWLPQLTLTIEGTRRAGSGCDLGPRDATGPFPDLGQGASAERFRLVDEAGRLVGIAEPRATPGLLHPVVVLM